MNWDKARQSRELSRLSSQGLKWWIVFARKGSRCSSCRAETFGKPIAMQYEAEIVYCKTCWERLGLNPKPSKSYLKGLQSAVKRQTSQGRKARRRRNRSRRVEPQQ
jgi:ribosome-binding protein aMBF1 (putative translation factor)